MLHYELYVYCSAGLLPEFDSVDKTKPNCVVIGDAAENFSYQNLNDAFRVLIGLEKPVLFSLGQGYEDILFVLQVESNSYIVYSTCYRYRWWNAPKVGLAFLWKPSSNAKWCFDMWLSGRAIINILNPVDTRYKLEMWHFFTEPEKIFVMVCFLYRRYYKETDGLKLDVGVYMKALEVQWVNNLHWYND